MSTLEAENGARAVVARVWKRWFQPTHRILLGTVGAYYVAISTSAAFGLGLSSLFGAPKANMLIWTIMVGFFVYCGAAIWAFAELHAWRLWVAFAAIITLSTFIVSALGGDPTFGYGAH